MPFPAVRPRAPPFACPTCTPGFSCGCSGSRWKGDERVCLTVHAPAREGGGFRVRSVLLATTLADGYRAMYQDMNSGVAR